MHLTGENVKPAYYGICGDDEDALFKCPEHVILYLGMQQQFGFSINPKKQLVGYNYHEFL